MPFLVFEGVDGSGKTTLIQSLSQELRRRNVIFSCTKEPGGTEMGLLLRKILLKQRKVAPHPEVELLLYYADRKQNIEENIKPSLAKKEWVISDRYWASTYAFQGAGRQTHWELMQFLKEKICKNCEPDLWILLDLPVEISLKRLKTTRENRMDRFEQEKKDFHERIRKAYLELAQKDPHRWLVLKAEKPPQDLLQDLLHHLEEKHFLKKRS